MTTIRIAVSACVDEKSVSRSGDKILPTYIRCVNACLIFIHCMPASFLMYIYTLSYLRSSTTRELLYGPFVGQFIKIGQAALSVRCNVLPYGKKPKHIFEDYGKPLEKQANESSGYAYVRQKHRPQILIQIFLLSSLLARNCYFDRNFR